jgi:hypothetical protein
MIELYMQDIKKQINSKMDQHIIKSACSYYSQAEIIAFQADILEPRQIYNLPGQSKAVSRLGRWSSSRLGRHSNNLAGPVASSPG